MKTIIRTVSIFLTSLIFTTLAAEETSPETVGKNRLFILDGSGSMWGQIDNRSKIEIAKDVMKKMVGTLSAQDQLGLLVYGHRRKGDCNDVELVYPMAGINHSAMSQQIDAIQPKGKTPITESVEQAVDLVRTLEDEAEIVLVSDGLETCKRDPCEAVKQAKQAGVRFRLHVVGFDLKKEETAQLKCMAEAGGGRYVLAKNAHELNSGIEEVVKHEPKPEELGEASISGPEEVQIGAYFEVDWEGPDAKHDYIAIRKADTDKRKYLNYAYSNTGSPAKLRAPSEPGDHLIYYMHGRSRQLLAEMPIKVVDATATLDAPESAPAGSVIEVSWTGPDGKNDYITVSEPDAETRKYLHYRYTNSGSPTKLTMPIEPGEYELRYLTDQKARVLATRPIKVEAVSATLEAPETVVAGADFEVQWTGPSNKSDYITIAAAGSASNQYSNYAYTNSGNPAKLRAAEQGGEYEIRYITSQNKKILASVPIEVTSASAKVNVPSQAMAGSRLEINWEGPNNKRDYITIVAEGEAANKYGKYFYTAKAKIPTNLQLPEEPGPYEVRYITGQSKSILTSSPIELTPATATLTVAETVKLGQPIEVTWTGPGGKNDKIILVDTNQPDKSPIASKTAKAQKTFFLRSPKQAGSYEIRYITGKWKRILAQKKVVVE
ncbi:VWA domain-containing protein [Candidatus Thiodiazotropha sp. CDECU1]|uniref:VWA domain-containing protein n=1 Tax=Candidatus Thiodiazotropha sp. CDECU1 TaxID=3065865 RepID=UPI0029317433|nr:VWA domain-containing protein [Candidatus Thiodiazotropha sp. CDECU1]